jgi:hemerythrin superfamily protein
MQRQSTSETTRGTIGSTESTSGDAIYTLIQDHTQIKALLEQMTGSQQQTHLQQTLEQLKQLLTIHNATEENFVYPALAKVAGKKHESEHLYHETALADMMIFEIDTALKSGEMEKVTENVQKLRAAILEHIDDEEQKAFPDLREHADAEHTAMLNRSVEKFRSSLHFRQS